MASYYDAMEVIKQVNDWPNGSTMQCQQSRAGEYFLHINIITV